MALSDEFIRKRDRALALLAATGMPKRKYLPHLYPRLWAMGVEVRPPHFQTLVGVLLSMGLVFGVVCGVIFPLLLVRHPSVWHFLSIGLISGFSFGFGMFQLYRHQCNKFGIPDWKAL